MKLLEYSALVVVWLQGISQLGEVSVLEKLLEKLRGSQLVWEKEWPTVFTLLQRSTDDVMGEKVGTKWRKYIKTFMFSCFRV